MPAEETTWLDVNWQDGESSLEEAFLAFLAESGRGDGERDELMEDESDSSDSGEKWPAIMLLHAACDADSPNSARISRSLHVPGVRPSGLSVQMRTQILPRSDSTGCTPMWLSSPIRPMQSPVYATLTVVGDRSKRAHAKAAKGHGVNCKMATIWRPGNFSLCDRTKMTRKSCLRQLQTLNPTRLPFDWVTSNGDRTQRTHVPSTSD
jgi:hypothetical protein